MPYEDRPEKDTPAGVRKMLFEYGGRTPDGGPAWRLVLAQNCRIQCFGTMTHAPQAKDQTELDMRETKPDRIEEGAFWVRRYKCKGWILQKWFPASTWGTREEWESRKAADGVTRLHGKYPENGDYYMMAGPWRSIEHVGNLIVEIQKVNRSQQKHPSNWDRVFREYLRQDREERESRIHEYETTLEIYRKTQILPVLKSTSSSAQRVRNEIQSGMGSGAHMGASEMWGN
jgi:hypothetical protein